MKKQVKLQKIISKNIFKLLIEVFDIHGVSVSDTGTLTKIEYWCYLAANRGQL